MLAPWKKSYVQPRQHFKKKKHYFASKGLSSQSYGFSIVMYECDSCTIKKAEHWRIDAFELWCWRKLLKVLWTARRWMQESQTSQSWRKSTLNIHWKDWCWSWSSNTLTTWCEVLTHWKRPWCWEGLKAGGEGWDSWMASPTQWTWVWVSARSWWWTGKPGMLQPMGSQRIRHNWATELKLKMIKRMSLYNDKGVSPSRR